MTLKRIWLLEPWGLTYFFVPMQGVQRVYCLNTEAAPFEVPEAGLGVMMIV